MTKEKFEKLYKKYNHIFAPVITKMIIENYRYCQIDEKINWGFNYNDNTAIMGTCNSNTNEIHLNILSCVEAFNNNRMYDIEYFVIHEMRHIFQHNIVKKYKNSEEVGVDKELIEQWIYELEHYIESVDSNGNENPDYFKQDIEFDAYAFSFAVMKYNNKSFEELWIPSLYKGELAIQFNETVDCWIHKFNEIKQHLE